ncbi:ribosome recycling factor [Patescibacteria group bacterium]|nr:ribosome recycling factor [Patescibacteria group bacterium]
MDIIKDLEVKLKNTIEALNISFQTIRSGQPSPRMVEDIKIEYYGQMTPIKALGSISIIPPREIDICAWDKGVVNPIVKAIENSSLKITASVDGNTIRINLPTLTEERKQELEKVIRKISEESRIRIRGIRDEINKIVKKKEEDKEFSEDIAFKKKEEIQKIVNKSNEEIEKILEGKINEIFR